MTKRGGERRGFTHPYIPALDSGQGGVPLFDTSVMDQLFFPPSSSSSAYPAVSVTHETNTFSPLEKHGVWLPFLCLLLSAVCTKDTRTDVCARTRAHTHTHNIPRIQHVQLSYRVYFILSVVADRPGHCGQEDLTGSKFFFFFNPVDIYIYKRGEILLPWYTEDK